MSGRGLVPAARAFGQWGIRRGLSRSQIRAVRRRIDSRFRSAGQYGLDQAIIHVESGFAQFLDCPPDFQQAQIVRLSKNRKRADRPQASGHRNSSRLGVIEENAVGMKFLGKCDRLALPLAEIKSIADEAGGLNMKPRGRTENPRLDWPRSGATTQFGDHSRSNNNRCEQNG